MSSSPPLPPKPPPPPPAQAPASPAGTNTTTLIPILIGVGVLMVACIGLPLLIGIPMLLFLSWGRDARPMNEAVVGPNFQPDFKNQPLNDFTLPPEVPQLPDLSSGSSQKEALYQQMLAAEQEWLLANAEYEAAQAVYEQQRNFNSQQAGRFGAQGISLPPAQPPDPSLQFRVQAAQARYDQAKAAYDAAQ